MSKENQDSRLFDVRHIERNIRHGRMTRKDYEKHLKSLPDVRHKAESFGELKEGPGGTGSGAEGSGSGSAQ